MRKIVFGTLIIPGFLWALPPAVYPGTGYPEVEISSRYRSDTIDYDETERSYFRERGEIRFSGESSLGLSHIFIPETGEKRLTWFLKLFDLSEHLKLLTGNFQASSGSGLFLGRKRYLSPDPFSPSLKISRGSSFIPEKSGNPLYAFNGIAAEFPFRGEFLDLSLGGFSSIRNRYIGDEDMERSATDTGLNTVMGKYDPSSGNSEPVRIVDHAVLGRMNLFRLFTLEACYLNTRLKGPWGNLQWDLFTYDNEQRGIEEYGGYGIFLRYGDDTLSLFTEYSGSRVLSSSPGSGRSISRGHGIISGISFRHPRFAFSATGKTTSPGYSAIYSGISPYPERSWLSSASYLVAKGLRLGAAVSSEKRLGPGKYQAYLPLLRREEGGLKWRYGKSFRFSLGGRRVVYTRDEKDERKRQVKLSSSLQAAGFMGLTIKGKYQDSRSGSPSGSAGGMIALFKDKFIRLELSYTRYFISRDNPLYTRIFHDENSISEGSFLDNSLQTAEASLKIRKGKNVFSVSYQATMKGSDIIRKKFRVMGKIVF